jgi:hypothetical protein
MVQRKPLFEERRGLFALLGAALLLAALFAGRRLFRQPGNRAEVFWNGERVWTFYLKDYTDSVTVSMEQLGFDVPVSFELREHQIRFVKVDCPDKLCEGFGFIGLPTQTAVCMPNRVSVSVVE